MQSLFCSLLVVQDRCVIGERVSQVNLDWRNFQIIQTCKIKMPINRALCNCKRLRKYLYFQVIEFLAIYSIPFQWQFFFNMILFVSDDISKILSESSVPGGPVCNVSILKMYMCTCTRIWFSMSDIYIQYENLFMIKKETKLFCILFTAIMSPRLRLSWRPLWQR